MRATGFRSRGVQQSLRHACRHINKHGAASVPTNISAARLYLSSTGKASDMKVVRWGRANLRIGRGQNFTSKSRCAIRLDIIASNVEYDKKHPVSNDAASMRSEHSPNIEVARNRIGLPVNSAAAVAQVKIDATFKPGPLSLGKGTTVKIPMKGFPCTSEPVNALKIPLCYS